MNDINRHMLIFTYKAQMGMITLEFSLSPRSLGWVLLPKTVLALLFGLATGTIFLIVIRVWMGFWPSGHLWAVGILAGLVAIFWSQVALMVGLVSRNYMSGAVGSVLGAMIIFFIGGGLSMVRAHKDAIPWVAWLFPNTYPVDPIRDLVLFKVWPLDFWPVLITLLAFASFAILLGSIFSIRKLRRLA